MSERKKAEEVVRVYAQLHEIDRAILAADTPEKIAWEALDRIQKMVPADIASVTRFDPDLDQAAILAVNGKTDLLHHPSQFVLDTEEVEAIEVLSKNEIQSFATSRETIRFHSHPRFRRKSCVLA
jgi:hypothetical protein